MRQIGTVPTLNYWTETGSETTTKVAEALQAGWKQAGINVKITAYEWNKLNDMQRSHAAGDQIGRTGWLADYPLVDNFLYPMFYSTKAGLNAYSFYTNPQVRRADRPGAGHVRRDTASEPVRRGREDRPHRRAVVIPTYFYRNFRVWNPTRMGGLVLLAVEHRGTCGRRGSSRACPSRECRRDTT